MNLIEDEFLQSFSKLIDNQILDSDNGKTKLSLFIHNISSNSFDYNLIKRRLLDPLIDFSLSKKTQDKLKDHPGILSKEAREKFIKEMNTGELGELLLYCFLHSHLKAQKILSKLELKTSNKFYVNGSDGIHILKLDNGDYQVIFGESKTIANLNTAIREALQSIRDFKFEINNKGKEKSGINFEKALISNHIENETFTPQEKVLIENIIYPKLTDNPFNVDDAFGIFIGYEIELTDEDKNLPNDIFRNVLNEKIKKEVQNQFDNIIEKINEYNLQGHCFYLYILPFTDLEKSRKEITEYITQ